MDVEIAGKIVSIPDDYDPLKETGEYMCDRQKAYFKHKLLSWLEDVKLKLSAGSISDVNVDRYSTDESDQMSIEGHILTELRSKDRLRKLAKKIEEFIRKIDNDTYGFCEESGNEIGISRLMARPIARFCIEVQEKKDRDEEESEFLKRNQDK